MRLIGFGLAAALLCGVPSVLPAQDEQVDRFIPLAAPLDPAATQAVAGVNHFTLDLFKRSDPGKNLFMSPASVSMAVALAYRGARGATADELRRVLYYTASPEAYLSVQAPLLQAMTFSGKGRELSTNNSLWLQDGLAMNAAYLADVTRNTGAGLQRVDYRADHERARKTINAWVSARTNNRINDLLSPENVDQTTRTILVNTIYWKANWVSEFAPETTKIEPFRLLDGRQVPAPLMHQQNDFLVLARDGAKAIELPYANGEVSMVVLMPDRAKDLPKFEARLTDSELTRWLGDLGEAKAQRTILTFPKMHMTWKSDLVPTFKAMGVKTAFDAGADFSGMATMPTDQVLAVGAIIHQAWLDVDETGSEAAAATAVAMVMITGARKRVPEPPPFTFRADKPFLFLLRDRRTGVILFMGRYLGPEKAA